MYENVPTYQGLDIKLSVDISFLSTVTTYLTKQINEGGLCFHSLLEGI